MGILANKTILITGVRTPESIAYAVAKVAQNEGANVILSSPERAMEHTIKAAQNLPNPAPVIPLDVTASSDLDNLVTNLTNIGIEHLDGVVHSIAFAHRTLMGGDMLTPNSDDEFAKVAQAFQISAYSYKALAAATLPVLKRGASLVGLTYDSRFAWPGYNWMGVNKAALEALNRYLARDLAQHGIRANLVSAGRIATPASLGIPGFKQVLEETAAKLPLDWDVYDAEPAAKAVVALLSDWFPMTTGDLIYADGGMHLSPVT